jgi:hypothetical protein
MTNNGMSSGFNTYTGQLAVSVQENGNGQWTEGAYPSAYMKLHIVVARNGKQLSRILPFKSYKTFMKSIHALCPLIQKSAQCNDTC